MLEYLLRDLKRKIIPEELRYRFRIYRHNWNCKTGKNNTAYTISSVTKESGFYILEIDNELKAIPSIKANWGKYTKGISTQDNLIAQKYGCGSYFEIADNDLVIDIGANVGDFSTYCQKKGAKVYAVEADDAVFKPLSYNVRGTDIKLFNIAIWNENTVLEFFSSIDGNDSSAIQPKEFTHTLKKKAVTLDWLTANENIETVKVIKCDAEGGEPEVLAGAIETLRRTEFISFDCGPERAGTSTFDICADVVTKLGFEVLSKYDGKNTILVAKNLSMAS